MSFAEDQGYLAATVADLMDLVMAGVNEQFDTDYDTDTFAGTNFYKYFYALIQRLQENEVRTSEIVLKLQEYFSETNEEISRPNTTHPGLFDYFEDAGYLVSSKKPESGDAGKLYVCVDVDDAADDYAAKKTEICTILKNIVVAGVVTQGTETEAIALSNDQSFDYKFSLPDRIPILLRLTIDQSDNNQFAILTDEDVAALLAANIAARYRLGLNFEPQRYFSIIDAPWAASILLEWSDDAGMNYSDDVSVLDFDELYEFEVGDISVINT
jgi:hypothetical protein